ncbi:MAG: IclR family transcriptional regulator [Corynebacterium humireducens]|jgi:DNA-binding IclR family transcriptional regulator|uniref:IclR family transcriptional regulator n=1 Tax=Corynebacterium humireducens TaxID=1223514 RepID=A0A7X6PQE0_9CORY|nr:IclR family transcriptional regulator [Corynebacterium humireducens]
MAGGSRQPGRGVLDRVSAVLAALESERRPLSMTEIAERADLPMSSAHRLINDLVDHELLNRTPDNRYQAGLRLWRLGQSVGQQLRETAHPYVHDLYALTGETSHLAIRDGREVLYIFRLYGTKRVARSSWTGGRLPLHSTGVGKVLLAYEEKWVQDAFLAHRMPRSTRNTIEDPAQLSAELARIREQGYATTFEEQRLGTCSIAVPIFHTGRIGAGLGIVLSADRYSSLGRYLPTLQAVSRRIEKATAHIPLESLLESGRLSERS